MIVNYNRFFFSFIRRLIIFLSEIYDGNNLKIKLNTKKKNRFIFFRNGLEELDIEWPSLFAVE